VLRSRQIGVAAYWAAYDLTRDHQLNPTILLSSRRQWHSKPEPSPKSGA